MNILLDATFYMNNDCWKEDMLKVKFLSYITHIFIIWRESLKLHFKNHAPSVTVLLPYNKNKEQISYNQKIL